MRVYRVSPQLLDIFKDVKANSQEEAELIVHNESMRILLGKGGAMDQFFDAGYLEFEEEDEEKEAVNPTPRYREDLIGDELKSDGVVCDTHERIWVGDTDIIDWPQKGIDERHPESDYDGVDVLDETYNIVISVNGVDTYFRTIDLDW